MMRVFLNLTSLFAMLVLIAARLPAESLKLKTNEEILHLMLDGKSERKVLETAEVETHLPDRFEQLEPRDAALQLVEENCDLNEKQRLRFFLDQPDDAQPPAKGTVGLRWFCSHCISADHGLTVLHYDGKQSRLLYSRISTRGRPPESAIRRAVQKTKTIVLSEDMARRLFEIIWWLGRVRFTEFKAPADENETIITGSTFSTGDGSGTFWITPGHRAAEVTFFSWPIGGRYGSEFSDSLYATFTQLLLDRSLREAGVEYQPTAEIGKQEYNSAHERFIYTQPEPSPGKSREWLDHTLRIVEHPRNKYLLESAVSNVVSFEDPMRYKDDRIDSALLKILEQAARASVNKNKREDCWEVAGAVARPLAWRHRAEAFPLFLQLLQLRDWGIVGRDDVLDAATILAGENANLRPAMVDYLRNQFADLAASPDDVAHLFDAVWRQDFRELRTVLERLATSSVDEFEDSRAHSRSDPPAPVTGKFHDARRILLAWSEPDSLAKMKLEAIMEASSGHLFAIIPAFLNSEYDALSPVDQAVFRDFVAWLRSQKIKYNWRPEHLESLWKGNNSSA